jgi:hypothetical protein
VVRIKAGAGEKQSFSYATLARVEIIEKASLFWPVLARVRRSLRNPRRGVRLARTRGDVPESVRSCVGPHARVKICEKVTRVAFAPMVWRGWLGFGARASGNNPFFYAALARVEDHRESVADVDLRLLPRTVVSLPLYVVTGR